MELLAFPRGLSLAGVAITLFAFYVARILLSPLSSLPGPWYTKFTGLVATYHYLRGTRPVYVHALHERYGSVVRISPTETDITDLTAIKTIYSIKDAYPKSPWYLGFTGEHDIFNTPDIEFHRRHRRLFGGSMSESSLKHYMPTVTSHIDLTISRMREELDNHGHMDIWKWWLFMTTDVIGELTFGESFNTLQQGKKSHYTQLLERAAPLGAIRTSFPSLEPLVPFLPIPSLKESFKAIEHINRYGEESISRYQNLLASDPARAQFTFFTKIFQAKENNNLSSREILSDAGLFIVAGSDTTANTLTYLVWSVCQHPEVKRKLLEELSTLPEDFADADVQKLPYLANIIDEALRLHPVVPTSLPRIVPPSGATLAGYWFPGGSTVGCQSYSMHRDPTVFPDPESFIPERWGAPTKAMKDTFMGFGRGSRVCLGMHLAYMELRLGITKFFREFPEATVSRKMTEDDMTPLMFFLIAPKGHQCLIEA